MPHNQCRLVIYARVLDLKTKRVYNTQIDEVKVKLVKELTDHKIVALFNQDPTTTKWGGSWSFR